MVNSIIQYNCCWFQDKACDSLDKSGGSSSESYETDEEWETERKKQAAVLEKDKVSNFTLSCF